MRECDSIHEFVGPSILDIKCLMIFQVLTSNRPENVYRRYSLKVMGEACTSSNCTQFISYRSASQGRGVYTGGKRTAYFEMKGKEVTTSFESMRMFLVALKKRPVMTTDNMRRGSAAVDNPVSVVSIGRSDMKKKKSHTDPISLPFL
jgi:hypothetical protein